MTQRYPDQFKHVRIVESENDDTTPVAKVIDISQRLETRRTLEGYEDTDTEDQATIQSDTAHRTVEATAGISRRRRVAVYAGLTIFAIGSWVAIGGPRTLKIGIFGLDNDGPNTYQIDPVVPAPELTPESTIVVPDTLGTPEEREGGPDFLPEN